jgi:hypothetical protein
LGPFGSENAQFPCIYRYYRDQVGPLTLASAKVAMPL